MSTAIASERPQVPGYFQAVTGLIRQPMTFFSETAVAGVRAPFKILLISAVFHTAVSFTYVYGRSVPLSLALLANSLALPFVMGGLSWMLTTMFFGKTPGVRVGFDGFFATYAYASAATLLFSWIPALGLFVEPWRLFIAGAGLAKSCGLGWKRGLVVLALSVVLFLMLIWSAMPVIVEIKELIA